MYSIKVLPSCCGGKETWFASSVYIPPGLFYIYIFLFPFFLPRAARHTEPPKKKREREKRVRLALLVNLDSNGWMIGMTGTWAATAPAPYSTRY